MTAMTSSYGRARVLLVEDDRDVREALKLLLDELSLDVIGEAANGAEGVTMAVRLDPDVVLMDMRMPVMGGLEAARRIRDERPMIQVVILTAYEDPALKAEAGEAEVYAYLVKGCPPGLIGDVTRSAGQMRRSLERRTRAD